MMAQLRGGLALAEKRPALLGEALKALGADGALVLRRSAAGWTVEHAEDEPKRRPAASSPMWSSPRQAWPRPRRRRSRCVPPQTRS